MTRDIEEFWEAKRRIERKLLVGVGAALVALGSIACADGPTGPYTEFEPQQNAAAETLQGQQTEDISRCGDIEVSDAVCEKGLGPPAR